MTEDDSPAPPPCPGPHHLCKCCRGNGQYHSLALYVSHYRRGVEATSAHECGACRGRGFYCKAATRCAGDHEDETPVLGADTVPPV
ncbi:hypothetical protein ACFP1Z_10455 [Streptomyces gamaensis]|uniref:Uncharacterized protein n=1 Tax=Streptomyces gamaensis TaxID=1763542 RepID=A0ABW0YWL0_9ACTN